MTEQRLVVRVAPTKHLLFLDAEFSTQYRAMRALADGGSAVPLPRLGWYEEDTEYFGVPFFSMDHVEGLVPSDNIPYTMEGWVIEATPEQQERMWWSGIDALAAVHRTDWRAAGLEWLSDPARGRPGLEQQMSYYRDFLDWATKGEHGPRDRVDLAVARRAPARRGRRRRDQLGRQPHREHHLGRLPLPPRSSTGRWPRWPSPSWTWAGGSTSTASSPRASACPARPGFGSHEDTIERYSELMGRPMRDIFFYEIFSGFRFAVVMYRLSDLVFDREDTDGTPTWRPTTSRRSSWPRCSTWSRRPRPARRGLRSVIGSVVGRIAHRRHRAPPTQTLAEPVRALVALLAHGLVPTLEDPVQLVDRTRSWR